MPRESACGRGRSLLTALASGIKLFRSLARRLGDAILLSLVMPAIFPAAALEVEYEWFGRPRPRTRWGSASARPSPLRWFIAGWKAPAYSDRPDLTPIAEIKEDA